jgi:cytochrome b6-f complex subunit 5
MIEPLVSGIVLGLIPVTMFGLFVAAYLQYTRGNELSKMLKEEEQRFKVKTNNGLLKK